MNVSVIQRRNRFLLYLMTSMLLNHFTSVAIQADNYDAPAGYYDMATGQGATLKKHLSSIMAYGPDGVPGGSDDHIQREYGDFRFSCALSDADPSNPGNILLLYSRTSIKYGWDNGHTWNREHVWPEILQPGSAFNDSIGNLGDAFSLFPSDTATNKERGSKRFGNLGSSGEFGIQSGGTWYPGDARIGDIARSLFYSDTRYDPTLEDISRGVVGDIHTLIRWNYEDPPDCFERRRNHTIYSSKLNPSYYQNNRNAYIDHPEYVWAVYGGGNNDSQIAVADPTKPDGGSMIQVDLGRIITGAAVPPSQPIEITKTGNNPTYFAIITDGDANSNITGRFNAFTEGPQEYLLLAGLSTETTKAGARSGTITIDNIDPTSSGEGNGAEDANDVITVSLSVLDHAVASFSPQFRKDTLTIDFGAVPSGDAINIVFDICNLVQTQGFTSNLDLDSITSSGDSAVLSADLTTFKGISPGTSKNYVASFDTSRAGEFRTTYTINLSDEDIPGAANQVLALILVGKVTDSVSVPAHPQTNPPR